MIDLSFDTRPRVG